MSLFTLYFQWPAGGEPEHSDTPHELNGEALEAARVSAAILYAGSSFMDPTPVGFLIVDEAGQTVYRYPET